MRSLAFQFRVSHQYISTIIKETLNAIQSKFLLEAIPEPTKESLKENAKRFYDRWNYPNCVGAIDGKHVRIVCPPKTGSLHYNYKDFFSIVLLAIVDANYKFVTIDVGAYGREGDSGIFNRSSFGKQINDKQFDFPPPTVLPGTNITVPHVIVGDEAFTLQENLMRSYPRKNTQNDRRQAVYNYRHSRARRTTENTFGLMASYFRIFHSAIFAKTTTIDSIVVVSCILHNFMRKEKILAPIESIQDTDNIICQPSLLPVSATRSRNNLIAFNIREKFTDFFNGIGRVDWQDDYLFAH